MKNAMNRSSYKQQGESYGWICTRLVLLLCKYNITRRLLLSSVVYWHCISKELHINGKYNGLYFKLIVLIAMELQLYVYILYTWT